MPHIFDYNLFPDMVFTSLAFIIFYIIVFSIYWLPGKDGQNKLVVLSGLVFYGWWDWRFAVLLLVTTGIDYAVGLALEREEDDRRRRAWLMLSLVTNLGVLGFFKYFNFFADSFARFSALFGMHPSMFTLQILLPMGISFYTFQALSYTIDVYRRELDAVHDPIRYFSFILFFPHLVAGPIVRAKDLLGQFNRRRIFNPDTAPDALRQMLWGFFIKVVIADNLAPVVSASYDHIATTSGWQLLFATACFAIQIYCDFAGYTHIAIGCARLLGIELMRNFAYPYFSRSIPEFWGRWHISLTRWFRQYLYLPLGGNRVTYRRWLLNILIVFLVSGLWHGANWTFVVWGLLHGVLYLAYAIAWPESRTMVDRTPGGDSLVPSLTSVAQIALTFTLTCLAWVFFRAASVGDAVTILGKIASDVTRPQALGTMTGRHVVVWILILFAVEWTQREYANPLHVERLPRPFRWSLYYAFATIMFMFAPMHYTPFIYFQF
jgi:D-alanyl-lipoteichoic acid acyltransferase DltB (MBOAT superfamily)